MHPWLPEMYSSPVEALQDAVALPEFPLVEARVETPAPTSEGKVAEHVADPDQLNGPPAQVVAQVGVPVGAQRRVLESQANVAEPVLGAVESVTFREEPIELSGSGAEHTETPSAPFQLPTTASHLTSPWVTTALG